MNNKSSAKPVVVAIILVAVLCLLVVCVIAFAGVGAYLFLKPVPGGQTLAPAAVTPQSAYETPLPTAFPTPTPGSGSLQPLAPTSTTVPTATPSLDSASETLLRLEEEIIPINDPIDLGERLGGKEDIPETLIDPDAPYSVGDTQEFWVTNVDTNDNFRVNTTLRYLGDHVYIWIENGVTYDPADLTELGDTFDDEIYPTNREFFGSEWSPGVDGDPRIYIVYAGGLGQSLAGYYSSADELHPEAHQYSNAHEMFLINSDNVYLWESYIYGTLAHEFQHMIHWYTDKNEETWLNEGFSMLAELINGFDPGGFEYAYISNTDLQLTDWGTEVGNNGPHYGAAMLFTTYFLDRFGEEATQALVAHDMNGLESIDEVMRELGMSDPLTGKIISGEDVFADWAVANFLGDPTVADGRYAYGIYPTAPLAAPTTTFATCSAGTQTFSVKQFGVDYLEYACAGDHTLTFEGSTITSILPTEAYSGDYFFWSNMGDHSNMSLERQFDLSEVSGEVEMTYQTWYDLETDYDYVFVSASTDGETWQILDSTSCTTDNPSGNSYGCGLNGQSNGWREEAVDLSEYAGEEVVVRFDYVTDAAVNGVGMMIDDIRVAAVDYFSDFEEDEGGWTADGFVRIENALPQTYRLSLITYGDEITVTPVELDEENRAVIDFSIGDDVESVVLVVSGTTPITRQKADYRITLD